MGPKAQGGAGRTEGSRAPGEVGGQHEAGADGRPKIEILGAREAGDAEAEQGRAARGQGALGAAELRRRAGEGGRAAPRLPGAAHLRPKAHLQQDRDRGAGLRGRPAQVPPPSVLANQLQREGPHEGQKRGWKRGHEEPALRGSPGLQGRPAQLSTPRDPSKDDVGEARQRVFGAAPAVQPCHLHQQLGLEAWPGGGDRGLRETPSHGEGEEWLSERGHPGEQGWGKGVTPGSAGGEGEEGAPEAGNPSLALGVVTRALRFSAHVHRVSTVTIHVELHTCRILYT